MLGKQCHVRQMIQLIRKMFNWITMVKPPLSKILLWHKQMLILVKKVYADIQSTVEEATNQAANNLSNVVSTTFKQNTQEAVKDLAKENGLTAKVAEQVVQQSANVIAREVEVVQKKAEIKHAEAEVEYKNIVAEAHNDAAKVAEAKVAYEVKNQQIEEDFKKEVATTVWRRKPRIDTTIN